MNYWSFSDTELQKRINLSPEDSPQYRKAVAEQKRRHRSEMLRATLLGVSLVALGVIAIGIRACTATPG